MKINGYNGYTISYEEHIPLGAKAIIIAMHGFAGDKSSSCIDRVQEMSFAEGIGLVRFDWPAHGESETTGDNLTVQNCLSDLNAVVNHVKEICPNARLIAFATSFGGYLTLLYNYYHNKVFDKMILRSPALKMYEVMSGSILSGELKDKLNEKGYIDFGYERIIKITSKFVNQLKENDLVKLYGDADLENVTIIHGTEDDIVPISDSIEFAKIHNCFMCSIKGADHRYKKAGELDQVISFVKMFLREQI